MVDNVALARGGGPSPPRAARSGHGTVDGKRTVFIVIDLPGPAGSGHGCWPGEPAASRHGRPVAAGAVSTPCGVTGSALIATDHSDSSADPAVIVVVNPEPVVPIEVADAAIQRLFRAGLALASCASTSDGPAPHLDKAIEEVDRVIRDLRGAAFDNQVGTI